MDFTLKIKKEGVDQKNSAKKNLGKLLGNSSYGQMIKKDYADS